MTDRNSANDPSLVCPTCDALIVAPMDARLVCPRCHTTLRTPTQRAGLMQVLLALGTAALIYGAVTLPFLKLERYWISNEATLVETALTFEGPLRLLSGVVLILILVLPSLRLGLNLYVLTPLVLGARPWHGAARAFRWSETLRPWSMAEIFVLGCGVALVKIIAMAEVTFGPAFYMFAGAVVLIWIQDQVTCRISLWEALDDG